MGYYYNDPSGLGSWYVEDNQTPAQAIQNVIDETGITLSPILKYSIQNNPTAQQIGGGNPAPQTKASPPQPTGYVAQGASVTPVTTPLTAYQKQHIVTPRFRGPDTNIPGGQPDECPDGYYYDFFSGACVPIDTGPIGQGPGPVAGVGASGPANVTVTVNNAVELSSGVGQAIADAVSQGIQDAVDQATKAASTAAQAVEDGIKQTVDAVSNAATGLIKGLKDALGYISGLILNNIGTLIDFVKNNIGSLVSTVKDVIQNVITPVLQQITSAIKTVNDTLNNTIVPIFNAISQTYNQTVALIQAIQQDINNGIKGILQLPADLANGLDVIGADISRAIDQVGLNRRTSADTTLSYPGNDSIWNRLEAIGHGVSILGGTDVQKITFSDIVRLSEPSLGEASTAAVNALLGEISAFVNGLFSARVSLLDKGKSVLPLTIPFLGVELSSWISAFTVISELDQLFEPFYDFAKEDLRAKAGLSKLPVGNVLDAWKRGFITDADLQEDLAVNGWDSGRIQVLKDLQKYVVDISTAIDMHYRGIVTDEQLTATLKDNGITTDQQKALLEQSIKRFDVNLAATAWRWKLIDDTALDAVLHENRYSDTEITAYKATLLSRETIDDTIGRIRFTRLYSGLGFVDPDFADVPADVLDAAARDGIDAQSATDRWQRSFSVPPLRQWIDLYFRGIRTRKELEAAFDYYRIPLPLRSDYIAANQALIPFRTIPTMLANGIIDEPYAKQQLQAHGFDLPAVEALLKYAQIGTIKRKSAASGDLHSISVGVARGYFELGTLTPEQYKAILLQHGYDERSADLTLQVETHRQQVQERKQVAADLAAEVLAGTVTLDQALAAADSEQFTPAEKSKLANTINRARRQVNKTPTEAQLHDMAKAGAITEDQYKQALQSDGWAQSWIDVFVKWRFKNAAQSTASA